MNKISFLLYMVLALLVARTATQAQVPIKIGISKDAATGEFETLAQEIKSEIEALAQARGGVKFRELSAEWQADKINENLRELLDDPETDIVITLGFLSSDAAAHLPSYPKPVIAATSLDRELQGLTLQADSSSGITNFSYTPSMIKLKNDMRAFYDMFGFSHLAVLVPEPLYTNFQPLRQFLSQHDQGFNVSFIPVEAGMENILSEMPASVDAAFVLPMIQNTPVEIAALFAELNQRQVPSLAVSGPSDLTLGASVTFTPQFTLLQMAREVALRVLKVSEGTNLSEIPVSRNGSKRTPVVNMESLRQTGKFPVNWQQLENAVLINVEKMPGETMELRQAIAQALENNLQGKITDQDLLMAQKEVRIAKANVLPQVEVSASALQLSQNLVDVSMGQRGEFTLSGSASLRQVIWSEAAFGNIALKKLAAEYEQHASRQTMLDIVSDVSGAYISLLFNRNNLQIKNENVYASLQNLELAKAKEQSGEGGISDVNRWTTEVSISKMELNDAQAGYRAAMYQLNELLNHPIGNTIATPDSSEIDRTIVPDQNILALYFSNPDLTEKYASFLISEMHTWSPELQQVLTAGEIVDRKKSMQIRQLFVPEVALFGQADQAFVREGTRPISGLPVPPPPDDITWHLGVKMSIPLFEGGRKRAEVQRTTIEQEKIGWQKDDLLNKIEKGLRSNVQLLKASYKELELAQQAARAAQDNYKIVQDAYAQGVTSVVQLIDAQNVMTRSKYMAASAYYQYILDYIKTERMQGRFGFLTDKTEQQEYSNRLFNNLNKEY
ncbi:MAG TPA: TolC family protein [Bacteroidales bacterium]|nr:TolC family protein [Bacteroidales bacterium]